MPEKRVIRSPDTNRVERVPPGQKLTERFPVLHHGSVPSLDSGTWTLAITGLVDPQKKLTCEQFMKLPQVRVTSDIHCVTGWSRLDNVWEGVSTQEIKNLTKVLPAARFVMVHAAGGFTTNLSLDDFFAEDVLFAVTHNGQPLTAEHGYPVRLVVPRLYFWKSAKWVTSIEFMAEERLGFWESAGYHRRGDPWQEERYSS